MPSPKNRVILASAGSGKTASLVKLALSADAGRVLLTTFTNENVGQINDDLVKTRGCVPPNVAIQSWYSFLLAEGVRPYQRSVCAGPRISGLQFSEIPNAARRVPRANAARYYLAGSRQIYRDRVADFVVKANEVSRGAVIRRLEQIYDHILVDEMQDLAGFDLDILDLLFRSRIRVTCVGDPRQATFSTNNSLKNKQFRGAGIADWLLVPARAQLLDVELLNECHRSNQAICDFADALFQRLPKSRSTSTHETGHDGIFFVPRRDVPAYAAQYKPVVLRHDRRADTMGLKAINYGASKGRTYDRVLIFPTQPILRYLDDRDAERLKDPAKFYVAVTRARYSVAFVIGK